MDLDKGSVPAGGSAQWCVGEDARARVGADRGCRLDPEWSHPSKCIPRAQYSDAGV